MDCGCLRVGRISRWGVEDRLSPENIRLAADGNTRARLEGAGYVLLTEPDSANISGFITEHRLGVLAASLGPLGYHPGLPDGGNDRAFLARHNLRDCDHAGIVLMPPGKQVEQVAHCGNIQPFQPH